MTGLTTCSTITLEDFQIVIPQQDLTIVGPATGMTIAHDGNYGRVFNHQGSGLLSLENLNITGGNPYSTTKNVYGGCIYSKGDIYLNNTNVTSCFANADEHYSVYGGGIFTVGSLTLVQSTLAGNVAGNYHSEGSAGGGAFVGNFFAAMYSSIRGNAARADISSNSGGVRVSGGMSINRSTISGNSANFNGGLCACSTNGGTATIENSTISGNRATGQIGGVLASMSITLRNSTIAFNTGGGKANDNYYGPGLAVYSNLTNIVVDLQSSILSNNTYSSNGSVVEGDFSVVTRSSGTVTVTGNHNLIPASFVSPPPGFVTVTGCPLLGPLRDNGGPTQTHALLSHSPAIDAGTNSQHFTYDQRGSPYKRADGLFINFADIGAYEVQQEDVVFNTSFEGCPSL